MGRYFYVTFLSFYQATHYGGAESARRPCRETTAVSKFYYTLFRRREHNYPLKYIANLDETSVTFDLPSTTTVDKRRNVMLFSRWHEVTSNLHIQNTYYASRGISCGYKCKSQ